MRILRLWLPVLALLVALQAMAGAAFAESYETNFDAGTLGSLTNRTSPGWSAQAAATGTTGLPSSGSYTAATNYAAAFLDLTTLTYPGQCIQVLTQVQQSGLSHTLYGSGSRNNIGVFLADDGSGNGYRITFASTFGGSTTFVQIAKLSSNGGASTTLYGNNLSFTVTDLSLAAIKCQYDGSGGISIKMWMPLTQAEPSAWAVTAYDPGPYNTATHNRCGVFSSATRTSTTASGTQSAGATTLVTAASGTNNFTAGAAIQIGADASGTKEIHTIVSITDATHMVITPALTNTHSSGESIFNAPPTYIDNLRVGPPGSSLIPVSPTPAATSISDAQVSLSWPTATGGDGTYYYSVQRSTSSDFTTSLTTLSDLQTDTFYNDASAAPSTTYYYRVLTRDALMNGTGGTPAANLPQGAIGAGLSVTTLAANVAAATYTATAPSPARGANAAASAEWVVQPAGYLTGGSLVVTVKDDQNSAVAALTFAPSGTATPASQAFTYTPSVSGARTLTFTHTYVGGSPAVSDPSPVTYKSIGAAYVIHPVNTDGTLSSAAHLSPGNWVGDGGTSASARWGTGNFVQAWTIGAYVTFYWTSQANASATVVLDTSGSPYPAPVPTNAAVSYIMDGQVYDNVSFGTTLTTIPICYNSSQSLPAGSHVLTVFFRNSSTVNRWSEGSEGTNVLRIQGLRVDGLSTPGTAPVSKGWIMLVGDSICNEFYTSLITLNTQISWTGTGAAIADHLSTYSYYVTRAFQQAGYDVGISACAAQGWIYTGSNREVPGYYPVTGSTGGSGGTLGTSSYARIDGNHSLLDSAGHVSGWGDTGEEPVLWDNEMLANEIGSSQLTSDVQASVTQGLEAVRAILGPNVQMIVSPSPTIAGNVSLYPLGATYLAAEKAGYDAYAASSSDQAISYQTFGTMPGEMGSGRDILWPTQAHPSQAGQALLGSLYLVDIMQKVFATAKRRVQ